jgi:hypothetical protein
MSERCSTEQAEHDIHVGLTYSMWPEMVIGSATAFAFTVVVSRSALRL